MVALSLLAATLESRCEQAADQLDGGARALEEALQRVEHDIGTIVGNGRDELARHGPDYLAADVGELVAKLMG